jgi:hypothetical protein
MDCRLPADTPWGNGFVRSVVPDAMMLHPVELRLMLQ